MEVGIRELRDNLSRHLAEVRNGHTLTITDRGWAIARIVPVEGPTRLQQLIAEGVVEPARSHGRSQPHPVVAAGSVSELVGDQRR